MTEGNPEVKDRGESFIVENASIGSTFHWHHVKSLEFKGEYEIKDGRLYNLISLEDYLSSVISSEMNPEAPEEFLKAHSVISRSWAYGKLIKAHSNPCIDGKCRTTDTIIDWQDTNDHNDCDLCNNDHCQRYLGISKSPERYRHSEEIVASTHSEILVDKTGTVVDARFSKHCGGHTEEFSTCWQNRDFAYLRAQPDMFCDLSDMTDSERRTFLSKIFNPFDCGTPFECWEEDIDKKWLRENIKRKFGFETGEIRTIYPIEVSSSGRLKRLMIDSDNPLIIGKELMIRKALSDTHLYSSLFDIEDRGEVVHLVGKGWGHGVGLCQVGAARMAQEGADYGQILKYYFPETDIKLLSETERE